MSGPGVANQQQLRRNFSEFAQQWPAWQQLRKKLEDAGFISTSVNPTNGDQSKTSWAIFAEPDALIRKQFELAPEILILCAPWDTMQHKDIEWAESTLRTKGRLDPGFVLVLSQDEKAEDRLRATLPTDRIYIFVSIQKLWEELDPKIMFRNILRESLGRRRLFDMRLAAKGDQFFGRERELETLERDVLTGQCVGVFGLRKVGKTSLISRLAHKFRETSDAPRVIPVQVDLLALPFHVHDILGLSRFVYERLLAAISTSDTRSPSDMDKPFDDFMTALDTFQRERRARLLVIFDEYEVLVDGHQLPKSVGIQFLAWIRGLAQSYTGTFSFILAGRNAKHLLPARIDGKDNPMYRFLKHFPLAGLAPKECGTMITRIGARVGLNFLPEALDMIVKETGGHPALTRTLCDLIDEAVAPAKRNPATIDTILIQQILPRFNRSTAVHEDMREFLAASVDIDGEAEDYLVHLVHHLPWKGGTIEDRIREALVNYGILHKDRAEFRIGHLESWLRENYAPPAKVAHA